MLSVLGAHALSSNWRVFSLAIFTQFAKLKTSPKFPTVQYVQTMDRTCAPKGQVAI